jgi:predicted permease
MRFARLLSALPLRLRDLFRRSDVERDLDDEVRDHLESQLAANLAAGMTPEEARRAAFLSFGGVERIKDESRDVRGLSFVDALAHWRHAARSLGRARTFTIAAVLTLTLAVAAGSTVSSLVNAVLLRPLPYPESDRLVGLWHTAPGVGIPLLPQALGTYALYRSAHSFEAMGAYGDGQSPVTHGVSTPITERLPVAGVTASIFTTLRTRPLLGRLFTETDELPGTPKVVVISEHFWRTRLAASPSALGAHIKLDGIDRTIVGVLPASFGFPGSNIDVWAPFIVDPKGYLGFFGLRAIGRLRLGVSIETAQHELAQILARSPETFAEQKAGLPMRPMLAKTQLAPVVHTLRRDAIGGFDRILWLAAATVAVLILVALSNLSSLLLARIEVRQRELALRSVLGASAARIWWVFLCEVGLVIGGGSVVGLALGAGALALLPHTGATQLVDPRRTDASRIVLPRLDEIHPDAVLLSSALALMLLFIAAAAAIGAPRLTTQDAGRVLRDGGRSGTLGRASQRLRAAFVAIEVALSLVLLSGSAMLGRSLGHLLDVDPGFKADGAVTFWTSLRGTTYFDQQRVWQFYHDALDRMGQLAGVDDVGIVTKLPLENGPVLQLMTVEEEGPTSSPVGLPSALAATSAGYFRAIGIPFIAGRSFDEGAVRHGANEAVVGRAFAIHYWHDSTGQRALGRRFRPYSTAPWHTVVGVVGDVRDTALTAGTMEVVYVPYTLQEHTEDVFRVGHDMAFVLRTRRSAAALAPEVRRLIQALDPIVPVLELQSLDEHVAKAGRRMRFVLALLSAGAAMTLALGLVGLYGVIAYLVNLRKREIGIRIALGLTPSHAVGMIVREGEAVVLAGCAVGVLIFLAFARLLRSLTYDVGAVDLVSLALSVCVVIAIASLATWLPARSAARIDPAQALRNDL